MDYFYDRKRHPVRPAIWLLSHVHSDHTAGLETVGGLVYCSHITKKMVMGRDSRSKKHKAYHDEVGVVMGKKAKYEKVESLLRGVDLDTPFEVDLGSYSVRITLLDASNHCPGAVMFLVQGKGKSVLYTGDIRAEKWWLGGLAKHPLLVPYVSGGIKKLDCLYLDTTFGYRGEPYICLLDNHDGLRQLMSTLKMYPGGTATCTATPFTSSSAPSSIKYFLPRFTSGFEDIWQYLAAAYEWKVHMDPDQISHMKAILTLQGRSHYAQYLSDDPSQATLHCCSCQRSSFSRSVLLLPVVNYSTQQVQEHNRPKSEGELQLTKVKELLKDLAESCDSASSIVSDGVDASGQRFIKFSDSVYLPDLLLFHYSRHSSYSECYDLVNMLQPKSVYPCVVAKNSWQQGFSMHRLFGTACQDHFDQRAQFMYDVEMCIATGKPAVKGEAVRVVVSERNGLVEKRITLDKNATPGESVTGLASNQNQSQPAASATSSTSASNVTVGAFTIRAPGTQGVSNKLATGVFHQTDAHVPASDSDNSDILDQLNMYLSPTRSPVRLRMKSEPFLKSPGVSRVSPDHALRHITGPRISPVRLDAKQFNMAPTPNQTGRVKSEAVVLEITEVAEITEITEVALHHSITSSPIPSSEPQPFMSSPARGTPMSSFVECEDLAQSDCDNSSEFFVSMDSLPQAKDVMIQLGSQCRLIRTKQKLHKPFKVEKWKLAPVTP